MENKDIENLLTPLLEESMNASLNLFIESKDVFKEDKSNNSFILTFLNDALEYYTHTNNIEKIDLINDLKQEFSQII